MNTFLCQLLYTTIIKCKISWCDVLKTTWTLVNEYCPFSSWMGYQTIRTIITNMSLFKARFPLLWLLRLLKKKFSDHNFETTLQQSKQSQWQWSLKWETFLSQKSQQSLESGFHMINMIAELFFSSMIAAIIAIIQKPSFRKHDYNDSQV